MIVLYPVFVVAAQVLSEPRKFKKETLQMKFVEMVKATKPGIRVSNIEADKCDEECLQLYFGNAKMSGGGKVESVEIVSETEAIIMFSDPTGTHMVYAHLFLAYPVAVSSH